MAPSKEFKEKIISGIIVGVVVAVLVFVIKETFLKGLFSKGKEKTNALVQTTNHLAGSIRFVKEDDTPMPATFSNVRSIVLESTAKKGNYKLTNPYPSGTRFKIYLEAQQDAYIYAIASNEQGDINILFPYSDGNNTLTYTTDGEIAIPKGNATMMLDDNPGIELFCLLYATENLNIYKLKNQLEQNRNQSFPKRLYNALLDKIVEADAINYTNKVIKFTAESKKTVLPIIVAIEHEN